MNKKQKFKRNSKLLKGFSNLANWKPNFSSISKESSIPISTVFDFYNKLVKQNRIKLWVEILSESEVRIKELELQIREERMKQLVEDYPEHEEDSKGVKDAW